MDIGWSGRGTFNTLGSISLEGLIKTTKYTGPGCETATLCMRMWRCHCVICPAWSPAACLEYRFGKIDWTDDSGKDAASNHTFFPRNLTVSRYIRIQAAHCYPSLHGTFSLRRYGEFVTYWIAVAVQGEETISRMAMCGQAMYQTWYILRPRNGAADGARGFPLSSYYCAPL
jgi:hypothetical protein